MKPREYREHLDEVLKDPDATLGYINACMEPGPSGHPDVSAIGTALKDIARSKGVHMGDFYFGQMAAELSLCMKMLKQLGFRIEVELDE